MLLLISDYTGIFYVKSCSNKVVAHFNTFYKINKKVKGYFQKCIIFVFQKNLKRNKILN